MSDERGVAVLGFGVGMSDERFRSPIELDHTATQWGWERYLAFKPAEAAALLALEEKVRGLIDGQLYGPAFFKSVLDGLDAARAKP